MTFTMKTNLWNEHKCITNINVTNWLFSLVMLLKVIFAMKWTNNEHPKQLEKKLKIEICPRHLFT